MPAYSSKALWEKLGVPDHATIVIANFTAHAIPDYLRDSPLEVTVRRDYFPRMPFIHIFVDSQARLVSEIQQLLGYISTNEILWVSWPKKAARLSTDLTEDSIRNYILPLGLVDVKVCSVTNELWSGLKLVIRTINRKP